MKPDRTKFDVSRETFERLELYAALVERWNPRINLVSRKSLNEIWTRHILDSVQIFRISHPVPHWADLGSGGGFPGLVCSILAKEETPDTQFTLVESDQRKSVFLRTVVRECGLNCRVVSKRIETIDPLRADIVSARALADLKVLMSFCFKHLNSSGTALLPKGASWKKELEEARKEWNFDAEPVKSLTEPNAVILKVKGVARA